MKPKGTVCAKALPLENAQHVENLKESPLTKPGEQRLRMVGTWRAEEG